MELETRKTELKQVYVALQSKGYAPLSQLVGWLLTQDPTYITAYDGARKRIAHLDRDELLREIVKSFIEKNNF